MKPSLTFRAILFLLLPLLCCSAFGQEAKKKTCRILFLEQAASAPQKLHLFDGVTSREVELPGMNLSPVYELPVGPLKLALLPAPPEDPTKLPPGAPAAEVPEGIIDFYLIVTNDPGNKVAPVRMQVVNSGADQLQRGQMLWSNLTDLTVEGKLGSEQLLVKPQSSAVMNPPVKGGADYPVSLSYRLADNEHLYPICETKWVYDLRSRSLALIFPREGSRTPRVLVFPDFRPERREYQPDSKKEGEK